MKTKLENKNRLFDLLSDSSLALVIFTLFLNFMPASASADLISLHEGASKARHAHVNRSPAQAPFTDGDSIPRDELPAPIHVDVAPATQLVPQGERLEVQVGTTRFQLSNKPQTEQTEQAFAALTAEERTTFFKNREIIITQSAKALTKMRIGFGTGQIVNNEIRYQLRKSHIDWSLQMIRQMPDQISFQEQMVLHDFYQKALEEEAKAAEARAQKSFREYGNELIQGYLSAIDQQIWSQARLVSNSNEFGVVLTGGFMALGGYRTESGSRGIGGLYDIGFSIGINKETKATVFQIVRDFEKFKSTTMPVAGSAGVFFKAGVYIANQRPGEFNSQGTSFYPPAVPSYTSSTPNLYILGMNMGVPGLTLPPSPIADMMTYTTTVSNRSILRVSISKIYKNYLHVETDLGAKLIRKTQHTISSALDYIGKLLGRPRAENRPVRCEALL